MIDLFGTQTTNHTNELHVEQVDRGVHRVAVDRRNRFAPPPRPDPGARVSLVAQLLRFTDIVVKLIWPQEVIAFVTIPTPTLGPGVADPSLQQWQQTVSS